MKKQIIFIYIAVAMVLGFAVYKTNKNNIDTNNKDIPKLEEQKTDNKESTKIVNPASAYCEKNGGQSEIRTSADGSQYGVCIFKNGTECDEWDFFAGRCNKDGEDFCGESTNDKCGSNNDCVEDGCSGQICRSKTGDSTMTTCEMKSCYENEKYGLTCQCKDLQCQWSK